MDFREAFHMMVEDFREFYREVRGGAELRDILLISIIPVVLTGVFLLPKPVQQGLMLDFQNVSVFNLFSYAFAHRGLNHFANNLVSYVTLVPLSYLLCVLGDEKKFFRYSWLTFVLLVPPVIALIELVSPVSPNSAAGFSGVASAFLGFLPISLVLFLRNRVSKSIQAAHALVLLLVVLGVTSYTYSGISASTVGTFAATMLLAAFYTYRTGVDEFKRAFSDLAAMQGHLQLVLFAFLLFLATPRMIFPANISRAGGTVDIFAHYLGLILGFFLTLLYLLYRNAEIEKQVNLVKS
jgi:hypothetical protein